MAHDKEFAWTGELPSSGAFVGYVNVKIEDDGILFTVRSEGSGEPQSYKVPRAPGMVLVGRLSDALNRLPNHAPHA